MGYACPVCETPQRDGEHLANHLAFTAMLGDQAHEDWLAEHAPEWEQASPAELADCVVDAADETAYEEVFEDTVDRRERGHAQHSQHEHGRPDNPREHDHQGNSPVDLDAARQRTDGTLDAEAQQILQEAQEMTEQLLDDTDDDSGDDVASTDHDSGDDAASTDHDSGDDVVDADTDEGKDS